MPRLLHFRRNHAIAAPLLVPCPHFYSEPHLLLQPAAKYTGQKRSHQRTLAVETEHAWKTRASASVRSPQNSVTTALANEVLLADQRLRDFQPLAHLIRQVRLS